MHDNKNAAKIQILDYQKPVVPAGQYTIKATQTVKGSKIDAGNTFTNEINIAIAGDRFTLTADAVHACFPPEGSLGAHTNVLPHISLKKSTLPWERSAYGNDDDEPWLALLLFDEKELLEKDNLTEETVTLAKVKELLGITLEPGQTDKDTIKVIKVKKSLLEKLLPTGEELKLLTHVRGRINCNESDPTTELAIVATNRLPREGSESTAYLVSLEGRYNNDGTFNYKQAGAKDAVYLVSLKKWGFACPPSSGKTFEELIKNISVGMLILSDIATNTPSFLKQSPLKEYLDAGYVPLPHRLRQCDQTYSWYHSPLSPCTVAATFTDDSKLPEFADSLIRYHQHIGMFDVSYAAAFEIGRALALADMQFGANIYRWKQHYNEAVLAGSEQSKSQQLNAETTQSAVADNGDDDKLEYSIKQWLSKLQKLVDTPFSYLVPDSRLLPDESIRFFKLDQHWLECLLYGAFSIGGAIRKKDDNDDVEIINLLKRFYTVDKIVSGCIVRSQLVAGYPDLQVDAYAQADTENQQPEPEKALTKIRTESLGAGVLLALFEGEIATVDLYLKPEGLHFGLDVTGKDEDITLEKDLFDSEGKKIELKDDNKEWWRRNVPTESLTRVLDIKKLSEAIQKKLRVEGDKISTAVFTMNMFQGPNKGRFSIKYK